MKYIITENKLNRFVLNYLDLEFKNATEKTHYDNDIYVFGPDGKILFEVLETSDNIYKLRISRALTDRVSQIFYKGFTGNQVVDIIEQWINKNYPDLKYDRVVIKTLGI